MNIALLNIIERSELWMRFRTELPTAKSLGYFRHWVYGLISAAGLKYISGRNPSLKKSLASHTLQSANVYSVAMSWCSISVHIDLPRRTAPIVSATRHSKSIKSGLERWSKESAEWQEWQLDWESEREGESENSWMELWMSKNYRKEIRKK